MSLKTRGQDVIDGYDYDVQVWVRGGLVQNCGHPRGECGCNARRYAGFTIDKAREFARRDAAGKPAPTQPK